MSASGQRCVYCGHRCRGRVCGYHRDLIPLDPWAWTLYRDRWVFSTSLTATRLPVETAD